MNHPARKQRHPAPEPVEIEPDEGPSIEDLVRQGLRCLDSQDYEQATDLFRQAMRIAPFRADVKELLALALDERPYKSAELHIERFGAHNDRVKTAGPLLGVKHHRRRTSAGRLAKPLVALAALAALGFGGWGGFKIYTRDEIPKTTVKRENEAVAKAVAKAKGLMGAERYEDAYITLEQALRLKPGDPQSIRDLEAECRYRQGLKLREQYEYSKAIGYLGEATELSPGNVEYHCRLGWVRHLRGQNLKFKGSELAQESQKYTRQAKESFEAALKIDPAHQQSLLGMARVSMALDDNAAAAEFFRAIIQAAPDSMDARTARNELDKIEGASTER